MEYSALTIAQLRAILDARRYISPMRATKEELIIKLKELDETDKRIAEMNARKEAEEMAHRQTRHLVLQFQDSVEDKIGCLEYPFSFVRSGDYLRECSPIPGQPEEDIEDFPNNITEYYWIHEGENDVEPWLCLCKLKNTVYVYYRGECDYTGFDCQGDMKIYASKDLAILIQYGMISSDYEKYIQETHP